MRTRRRKRGGRGEIDMDDVTGSPPFLFSVGHLGDRGRSWFLPSSLPPVLFLDPSSPSLRTTCMGSPTRRTVRIRPDPLLRFQRSDLVWIGWRRDENERDSVREWTMMKMAWMVPVLVLLSFFPVKSENSTNSNPELYHLGCVLSDEEYVRHFSQVLQDLNFNKTGGEAGVLPGVTLYSAVMLMNPNPIRTALDICAKLIKEKVYAIVVSHPSMGELSPAAVSYTAGFYHIPVIGISSRDSAFSDKNIHVSFLRTVPPYSHQADVWVQLLVYLGYNQVRRAGNPFLVVSSTLRVQFLSSDCDLELFIFLSNQVLVIQSSDTDGRAILGRFQSLAHNLEDETDIKVGCLLLDDEKGGIEAVIEYEAGHHDFKKHLLEAKSAQARVILLYASRKDAENLFRDAVALEMTTEGYVWIVSEQALEAQDVPEGILGLRLINAANEKAHINDSLFVLSMALKDMYFNNESIADAPDDCDNAGEAWETGDTFFRQKQELIDGYTGKVAFDENGDRMNAEYEVVNVQSGGHSVPVGNYKYSREEGKMVLKVDEESITWPGPSRQKPEGKYLPTFLQVLTIREKPFVYARPIRLDIGEECKDDELVCPEYKTPPPQENSFLQGLPLTNDTGVLSYCCRGYCMDLLRELSHRINFTFSLKLSPDGVFGSNVFNNNTGASRDHHFLRLEIPGKKEWTGLIGELVTERADMIVAPLTINPERAQVIDFSKPFKYQGIAILEKRASFPSVHFRLHFVETAIVWNFNLWILVMVSVHVVALVLYLLDRFSPFGRFRVPNTEEMGEDALNLSSAIWFAWGVLLNSGIGEGTPRSFSARVLGMVWAGFAMIIVASYTANLAAFLVLDRPKSSLSGINDARLRNPMENFTYATVKGSAVDMYFRRQVELSNMYRTMEGNNYDTAEEAIDSVKEGRLNAFIWDSSRLEFEAARDCRLITAGELFGRSGYAVGLRKGSPWTDRVTLAILDFHERGLMEDLDDIWVMKGIEGSECGVEEKAPATLKLRNMAGVFMLVAAGIVGGVGLIIIEIIYKKHAIKKQHRMDLARSSVEKWRSFVEVGSVFRQKISYST
ncbi:unnamed protein product [Darwinula stevensoni]|uniref:Glutamate [NMDA] receptor subunit 1 n=1 Tax=Darwinula stevensoni TaxID=69355 RepID=A0A7R8ZXY6_9CRUS|nr:unnamed protein product [Darwinula stevensoni]CAG0880390.1 unnamed protein product [Darwinula stevensoni]